VPAEIGALNRVVVGDGYTQAATLISPGVRALTIFVYNNSVLYQLATDKNGQSFSAFEAELSPGYFSLARDCSGIRFRNEIAGQVGIVSVKLLG